MIKSKLTQFIIASVALVSLGLSTACSGSTAVLASLKATVVAADAGLAVLSAAGAIPPTAATLAENYLASVSTAVSATATELASSDTVAIKDSKVAEIWAKAVLPDIPGLPSVVSIALKAVEAAVNTFLGQMNVVPSTAAIKAHAIGLPVDVANSVVKVNFSECRELHSIKSEADKITAKLHKK